MTTCSLRALTALFTAISLCASANAAGHPTTGAAAAGSGVRAAPAWDRNAEDQ